MLTWSAAHRVLEIGAGARRFCHPSVDDPPPFPGFASEPVGIEIDAPDAPALLADPDDPVEALAGRPSLTGPAIPEFSTSGGTSLVRVRAAGVSDRYGLGEVCGSLRHENRRVTGMTRDAFAYDDRSDNLYQAHPWVLCVRQDGSAFGVIVETTWRFTAHCYDHLLVEVEGPPPAVTVIEGADPAAVLSSLAELTGHMPMPPRWALGYQQSKWNYAPASQVLDVATEFRDRQLPADVIWIDIDYMDGYRVFSFDEDFGDPSDLNRRLHELGWRSAWMIDPGLKVDDDYDVYRQARAGDHLLLDGTGEELRGVVWPGVTAFPDFTRAETRRWWAGLYEDFLAAGVDAVWNDMNEPANLEDTPDKSLPSDAQHRADDDLGGPDSHARYRNVYGLLMTEASRAGMAVARPDARPFLLTRSTFLGGHRHAATWTGDNVSTWEHLAWSIPMALNLGLSGQPLVGPDIGGFAGRCDAALLARWMGIGCLFPFARNHNMKTMPAQEPWAFGEEVEATCRRALERRYRLLPFLYTLAREAATTGVPIMRPAFFADPTDPTLRGVDTSFLLGEDLYVRCDVAKAGAGANAPIPVGWRRVQVLGTAEEAADPDLPELYLRPGAVLALGPIVQWSDERPLDDLELLVHLDADGRAEGLLYEDDGDGHGHVEGEFRTTRITVTSDDPVDPADAADPVSVQIDDEVVEGDWPRRDRAMELRLVPERR